MLFCFLIVELAMIMDRLYGGVCYAGIDTDPELKYPKGAGRVAFSNQNATSLHPESSQISKNKQTNFV